MEKTQLTEHFTLEEMLYSSTAERIGMINYVADTKTIYARLQTLCERVLEPLRQHFGPIRINSGYRSPALNYVVGGVKNSQHKLGEAADIYTPTSIIARDYFRFIRDNLDFDQLIFEENKRTKTFWIHVSYTTRRPNRKQVIV